MATTGKKWAIGCGIGCLLLLVVLGGIGTCGYVGFRKIADRADELEVHMDELKDRFEPREDFVPAADGSVDATTIQIFLTARAEMLVRGAPVVGILETLEGDAGKLTKIRAGIDMVPAMMEFIGERAAVLLENDLSPGEYTYLYAVTYFSWLGHDLGDGPDFDLSGNGDDDEGVRWSVRGQKQDVHGDRARAARRALNELMISWLTSQQDALAMAGGADTPWAETLAGELEALQIDPERLAWEDGLPPALEASLAPYREDLDDTYAEILNGLEVSLLDND